MQVKSNRQGRAGKGGKRGKASFSRASRRRLLYLLASLNRAALPWLPLFLTLTYPAVWSENPNDWKSHAEALYKRLVRQFPACKVSIIWRLEPQERGAPHFHLFVFGVRFIDYKWLARAWYEIVASGDVQHLSAGTRVERVKSWRGVMSYASKYVAKVPEAGIEFGDVGRWWGVKGKAYLPLELVTVSLNFRQFYWMRRVIRRYLRQWGIRVPLGRFAGATAFLPSEVSMRLLDYLTGEA